MCDAMRQSISPLFTFFVPFMVSCGTAPQIRLQGITMPVTTTATSSNFPGAQLALPFKHKGTAFVAYLSDSAKNRVQNSSDPRVPGGRGLLIRILKYRQTTPSTTAVEGSEAETPVGDIQPGVYQIGATPGPATETGTVIDAMAMFKDTDAKCLDRVSLVAVSGQITVPSMTSTPAVQPGQPFATSNVLGELQVDLTFPGGERVTGSFNINAHGGLAHGERLSLPNPDCLEEE